MKSLNKHVPTFVFALGLAFLIYSMVTFFHPPSPNSRPKSAAPALVMAKPIKKSAITRPPDEVAFNHAEEQRRKFVEELRRPADEYLKKVGLKMQVPEGVYFLREDDGPIQVLLGANEPGRVNFYLFSMKAKTNSKKAFDYAKKYFEGQFDLVPKDKGQPYLNKAGFKDMTLSKGVTSLGEEYQAYFFQNPRSKTNHLILLRDKMLSRQPARVRELIDSIR